MHSHRSPSQLHPAPRHEAAFFDLDKTVISKPAMVALARTLHEAGLISRRLLARAAWNHLRFRYGGAGADRMAKFQTEGLRIVTGWDSNQIRNIVHDSIDSVLAPTVFPCALALIRAHQTEGHPVFLVTAEPEEIVEPLGEYLAVDQIIASKAEVDASGRYTGKSSSWIYGPQKATAIRDVASEWGIDLARSFAYSDAVTDLPMLEAVGHPVVVNPDRGLRHAAEARGWEIRRFRVTDRTGGHHAEVRRPAPALP